MSRLQVWSGGREPHKIGYAILHCLPVCRTKNVLAEYHGESGSNAVHRLSEHEAAIVNKNTGNAMAKYLTIYHHQNEGDPDSIEYSVAATFRKNLESQISE